MDGWRRALSGLTATHHLLGNHLVTVVDDAATCTATFQATHFLPNPHGEPIWTLGGHYEYRLQRTREGWRIAGLTMTADWATGNQHIMHLAAKSSDG